MCLLIKLDGEWPSDAILEAGVAQNRDGIGIAFPDGDKVQYHKGITMEQLMSYKEQGVTKGLIHFRMTSIGPTIPQLCHPFPISKKTGNNLSGRVEQVLAHNGHWAKWEDWVWDNLKHAPMPRGAMSDTRAIAWLTGIHGMGFLRMLNEKIVVVTPTYTYQFGRGWVTQPKDQGYQLSYDPMKRGSTVTTYYQNGTSQTTYTHPKGTSKTLGKWQDEYDDDAEGGYESIYGIRGGYTSSNPYVDRWQQQKAEREKAWETGKAAFEAKNNKAAIPSIKPETTSLTGETTATLIEMANKGAEKLQAEITVTNHQSLEEFEKTIEAHDKVVAEYIETNNLSTHWTEEEIAKIASIDTLTIVDTEDEAMSFSPETSETYAG